MKSPAERSNRAGQQANHYATNNNIPADRLLNRLDKVRPTGSDRWYACCPAHEDRTPSLSIREAADGRVLLHCFSGCQNRDVVAAIGLTLRDLFPESARRTPGPCLPRSKRRELEDARDHAHWVVGIFEADRLSGKPLTAADRAAFDRAQAILRKVKGVLGRV